MKQASGLYGWRVQNDDTWAKCVVDDNLTPLYATSVVQHRPPDPRQILDAFRFLPRRLQHHTVVKERCRKRRLRFADSGHCRVLLQGERRKVQRWAGGKMSRGSAAGGGVRFARLCRPPQLATWDLPQINVIHMQLLLRNDVYHFNLHSALHPTAAAHPAGRRVAHPPPAPGDTPWP